MNKYALIFLFCFFMPLGTTLAQPVSSTNNPPTTQTIPTPEEFQNSIRARQNTQNKPSPQPDIKMPSDDEMPPLPAPTAEEADKQPAPESSKPIEQAPTPAQPVSPIPALPAAPDAAAAPSRSQVFTGFQSNTNTKTNSKTPANQEKWNIRY